MSVLFFPLRGVPDDEADDVRQLLISHEIEFYETSAGNWGLSMPAIWLYTPEDLQKIQPFFDAYQQQRTLEQRALYKQAKNSHQTQSLLQALIYRPVQLSLYSGLIALIIYISFKWLFDLGL
jgi:hypothetical protein